MAGLRITSRGDIIELDNFYKTLMFQKIMDSEFSRNERDTLLVVFRKTIHFDKWSDTIGIYWLSKGVGISENTLRATISRLEEKNLLNIERSKGGKTKSSKRFHTFSISKYLINNVFNTWEEIKEENGIQIKYIE